LRIVIDTRARLSATSKLAKSAKELPTILVVSKSKRNDLSDLGVELMNVAHGTNGRIDMSAMLAELGRRGITRLLVEGGAQIHSTFLSGGLADRLELFTAPIMLGDDARGAAAAIGVAALREAPHFERTGLQRFGPDLLESFVRKA
jgi:diaminohydroxyphosphoribosylaminopyrimidine deaminase/5-amino-6-(5-phosphoribosylamino)uracil reductase